MSLHDLFATAAPDLRAVHAVEAIRSFLARDAALAAEWQTYSYDKRWSPSPYLDGGEVGFFDGERRDVVHHDDRLDACADFIWREARWVLARER